MKEVARVWFRGGGLVLSVATPYDRQLLLEELDVGARRHGRIELELQRRRWQVSLADRAFRSACAECGRRINGLMFAAGPRRWCTQCATADLPGAPVDRSRSLLGRSTRVLSHPWARLVWQRAT